ncbi:MAG: hypothetical protein WC711_02100 [Candidatus Staskawiczbacteria bacterium]|jgi:hypothetical protein
MKELIGKLVRITLSAPSGNNIVTYEGWVCCVEGSMVKLKGMVVLSQGRMDCNPTWFNTTSKDLRTIEEQ